MVFMQIKLKKRNISSQAIHDSDACLAKDLYSEWYEIIVITHLDHGHMYNHTLINSISFIVGKQFCNTKKDYRTLKQKSDKLCKEYSLFVIQNRTNRSHKINYNMFKIHKKHQP